MTESVARLQSFINDVKAADVPRVRLKQEAQGRANCQLSLDSYYAGNGNIQIIATELQIISEHPILLESGSHHQAHHRQTPAGHSKPLAGRAFRQTVGPSGSRTKLAIILSFIRRYSSAVVQIVCKRRAAVFVVTQLDIRYNGCELLSSAPHGVLRGAIFFSARQEVVT